MNKKILLIFHLNFLRNDMGCSAYTYEIAKYLKSKGFSIDFLTNLHINNNFQDFHELNKKEKIVDNFYPFEFPKFCGIKIGKFRLFGYKIMDKQRRWYILGIGLFKTNYVPTKKGKYYSTWMNDFFLKYFQNIIDTNHYDYIHIHYIQFADLLKYAKLPENITTIYSMQDANYIQTFYSMSLENYLADNLIEKEIKQISLFDKIIGISNDEIHFARKFLPDKKFYFLPHPLKKKELVQIEKDIDVLFLGFANVYNVDAVKWLVNNVYPYLNNKSNIWIVGKVCEKMQILEPDFVEKMVKLGINMLDFAEDLDELYARTKISIVPIFQGTGMKIKTVDSMSRGIPVVSSSLGVDGFPDKNNNGCLISDDPKVFADYINTLLEDEVFYNTTKQNICNYFDKYLSLDANEKTINEAFDIADNNDCLKNEKGLINA